MLCKLRSMQIPAKTARFTGNGYTVCKAYTKEWLPRGCPKLYPRISPGTNSRAAILRSTPPRTTRNGLSQRLQSLQRALAAHLLDNYQRHGNDGAGDEKEPL